MSENIIKLSALPYDLKRSVNYFSQSKATPMKNISSFFFQPRLDHILCEVEHTFYKISILIISPHCTALYEAKCTVKGFSFLENSVIANRIKPLDFIHLLKKHRT